MATPPAVSTANDTSSSVLIVYTNFPDLEIARHAIRILVKEERLAACGSVIWSSSSSAAVTASSPAVPPIQESTYWWQGDIFEQAMEYPVIFKTTSLAFPRFSERFQELHPYQVPELVAVPVVYGLPTYLQWVRDETCGGGCGDESSK